MFSQEGCAYLLIFAICLKLCVPGFFHDFHELCLFDFPYQGVHDRQRHIGERVVDLLFDVRIVGDGLQLPTGVPSDGFQTTTVVVFYTIG